jgi:hypothetical protein
MPKFTVNLEAWVTVEAKDGQAAWELITSQVSDQLWVTLGELGTGQEITVNEPEEVED